MTMKRVLHSSLPAPWRIKPGGMTSFGKSFGNCEEHSLYRRSSTSAMASSQIIDNSGDSTQIPYLFRFLDSLDVILGIGRLYGSWGCGRGHPGLSSIQYRVEDVEIVYGEIHSSSPHSDMVDSKSRCTHIGTNDYKSESIESCVKNNSL